MSLARDAVGLMVVEPCRSAGGLRHVRPTQFISFAGFVTIAALLVLGSGSLSITPNGGGPEAMSGAVEAASPQQPEALLETIIDRSPSLLQQTTPSPVDTEGSRATEAVCGDRDPHPPIVITEEVGQAGFSLGQDPVSEEPIYRPGSGVVDGTGTEADPYVIEGWCLTGPFAGVVLNGTNSHVVIRNNSVHHPAQAGLGQQGPVLLMYMLGALHVEDSSNASLAENEIYGINAEAMGFTSDGIHVHNSTDIVIADNFVKQEAEGISVTDTDDVEVTNNVAKGNWETGIVVDGSTSVLLEENAATGSYEDGGHISNSQISAIRGNTFTENRQDGLRLEGVADVPVRGNVFSDNGETGFQTLSTSGVLAEDNEAKANAYAGLFLLESDNATVRDSVLSENGYYGLRVGSQTFSSSYPSPGALVAGNTVRQNGEDGILLDTAGGSTLQANTVEANEGNGIAGDNVPSLQMLANTVQGNGKNGIDIEGAVMGTLEANEAHNNTFMGIRLADSEGTTVAKNTVRGNGGTGVWVGSSSGALVGDNHVEANQGGGIALAGSDLSHVSDNVALANGKAALRVEGSEKATVANNLASGSKEGLRLGDHWLHGPSVDTHVEGNELVENAVGLIVAEELLEGPVAGSLVEGNEITRNEIGTVVSGQTPDTRLRGNNIHDNEAGVGLDAADAEEDVDARDNWWGCPDGPDAEACDDVVGLASYEPWLEQPNADAGSSTSGSG